MKWQRIDGDYEMVSGDLHAFVQNSPGGKSHAPWSWAVYRGREKVASGRQWKLAHAKALSERIFK